MKSSLGLDNLDQAGNARANSRLVKARLTRTGEILVVAAFLLLIVGHYWYILVASNHVSIASTSRVTKSTKSGANSTKLFSKEVKSEMLSVDAHVTSALV